MCWKGEGWADRETLSRAVTSSSRSRMVCEAWNSLPMYSQGRIWTGSPWVEEKGSEVTVYNSLNTRNNHTEVGKLLSKVVCQVARVRNTHSHLFLLHGSKEWVYGWGVHAHTLFSHRKKKTNPHKSLVFIIISGTTGVLLWCHSHTGPWLDPHFTAKYQGHPPFHLDLPIWCY